MRMISNQYFNQPYSIGWGGNAPFRALPLVLNIRSVSGQDILHDQEQYFSTPVDRSEYISASLPFAHRLAPIILMVSLV